MRKLAITEAINGNEGYSLHLSLTAADLEKLRKLVRIQWLYRLQLLSPLAVRAFDEAGMEQYHQHSHMVQHENAWPKTARVLPREAVDLIKEMTFFKTLKNEFGEFRISDEEHFGWENIYWRLVRPGKEDCGSLHADKWFWDIGGYGKAADFPHERVKIWVPLYSVKNKNGLLVVPGSHAKDNWKWHTEVRYGLNKPIIDEPIEALNPLLLPLAPGEAVLFHDGLIHGGAPNLAETTRVSLEFTLLVPSR